jgi:Right handed beta helix region
MANLVPVDLTGATDVTAALNAYIASVPNGSTINFKAGGTYKISSSIDLRGRSNLVFEGNGATLNNVANANSGSSEPDSFFYTQAPGHSGAVSTNITIRDFTAKGANPTPGKLPAGEFAAFLTAYGGSGYTVENITASGLFGDFVNFNGAADGAEISGNHITDCGRNSISVVWASDITYENNTIGTCGWSIFDVEPESASAGSTISGLIFRNNTAIAWSSATGFFFAADGNATTHINGVTVTGNTISQSSIQTIVNVARRQNITFTNNTGLAAQPVKQGEPGMLTFAHIDGLTVTGNVQPLSSGTLLSITDCTSVVHQ